MRLETTGLLVAPLTPFKPDLSVNYEQIELYMDFLKRNGVSGAFINGTTGEGLSLSIDERKRVVNHWIDAVPENFKLIVHVGSTSLKESQDLVKHAEEWNADAVGTLPPIFFKPTSIPNLVSYLEKIAQNTSLPLYYYHIPSLTGVEFPMLDLLQAVEHIPNFAGIKYTFETLSDYRLCVRHQGGKYDMLFGRDEILLPALTAGAKGFIGSTYNVIPKLYLDVIHAFEQSELRKAQELQDLAIEFIQILLETGSFFSALKTVISSAGIDCGSVRDPLVPLSEPKQKELLATLKNHPISEYLAR